MEDFLKIISKIPVGLFTALASLIAALVALYGLRRHMNAPAIRAFIECLAADIAALNDPSNESRDAFTILEHRFVVHHQHFIPVYRAAGWLRRMHLRRVWTEYYGEENEQNWYLPNEYSVLLSNQLKNTAENTKQLAIHRLQCLIRLCS